jgi:hypothetical protein
MKISSTSEKLHSLSTGTVDHCTEEFQEGDRSDLNQAYGLPHELLGFLAQFLGFELLSLPML